jgi:hypothetical protein
MLDTYKISQMENLSSDDLMSLIGLIQNYSSYDTDHELALVENAFFDFIAYYFSDERGHNRHYRAMWINDGPSHDRFDEFGWWRGGYGVLFGWSKIVETQGFAQIYNPKRWSGSTYKGPNFVSSHWTGLGIATDVCLDEEERDDLNMIVRAVNFFREKYYENGQPSVQIVELDPLD